MFFYENNEGFTLIEVMLGLVLSLILIFAFSGAIISGIKTESFVDDRLEAKRVTNSIIENLYSERDNLESNSITDNINSDYKMNLKSNEENNTDITLKISEVSTDLYLIELDWIDRKYGIETLLAGE